MLESRRRRRRRLLEGFHWSDIRAIKGETTRPTPAAASPGSGSTGSCRASAGPRWRCAGTSLMTAPAALELGMAKVGEGRRGLIEGGTHPASMPDRCAPRQWHRIAILGPCPPIPSPGKNNLPKLLNEALAGKKSPSRARATIARLWPGQAGSASDGPKSPTDVDGSSDIRCPKDLASTPSPCCGDARRLPL